MSYKNTPGNFDSFDDCFDQLFEIHEKFKDIHSIYIGGDLNEDISKELNTNRSDILRNVMSECDFVTQYNGPTFINVHGQEVSELDYFMFKDTNKVMKIFRMTNLPSNVSDNYTMILKTNIKIIIWKSQGVPK